MVGGLAWQTGPEASSRLGRKEEDGLNPCYSPAPAPGVALCEGLVKDG